MSRCATPLVSSVGSKSGDVVETHTENESADQAGLTPGPTCPDCSANLTLAIREIDGVSLHCEACSASWHFELGFLRRAGTPSGEIG